MFPYSENKRPLFILYIFTLMFVGSACTARTDSSSLTSTLSAESYQPENIVFLTNSDANSAREVKWTTENPPSMEEVKRAVKAGEASEKLAMMGDWWLYGPGMGYTILNLGTVVLFPPYALYLLGNAAFSMSGNEPIRVVDVIPEGESRAAVEGALDDVCSVPGRLNAVIAGKPFVERVSLQNN